MSPFEFRGNTFYCEDVALADIAARAGTPCYVYAAAAILERFRAYDDAFAKTPHTICYAVKANSNLSVLGLLARAGSGFDIVSAGELYRVLAAGGDPAKVVFSGVGKTAAEIECALASGMLLFNCESEPELALLDSLAGRRGVKARVAMRVNPDVDAATHAYISTGRLAHKFGIALAEAEGVYYRARELRNLSLEGVSCHIGSQLLDARPVMDAIDKVLALIDRLRASGIQIRHVDLGGGLGVRYTAGQEPPPIRALVESMLRKTAGRDLHLMVEPGRSIVAEAGVLLTRVLYRKTTGEKQFVIVDAAMNDLLRPALYKAHHDIVPLRRNDTAPRIQADVVGPVCETGDFLAHDREMADVMPGDFLAVCTAGAYGFAQASNYNARPRVAEVMVDGASWRIVRARETFEDLVRGEIIPA